MDNAELYSSVISDAADLVTVTDSDRQNDVFNLVIRPARRCALDPTHFCGSGLYAIGYEGKAVYIGSFRGNATDPFGSNIVQERWWKHLSTLTLRGDRVLIRNGVVAGLRASGLLHPDLSPRLDKANATDGCTSTRNRVLFASSRWDEFGRAEPSSLLTKFTFGYVRTLPRPLDAGALKRFRSAVEAAERSAIEDLQPQANGKVAWQAEREQKDMPDALDVLRQRLHDSLTSFKV